MSEPQLPCEVRRRLAIIQEQTLTQTRPSGRGHCGRNLDARPDIAACPAKLGQRPPAEMSWLESGVHIKAVADLLGHSSVAVTGDVYVHTSDDMARPVVEGHMGRLGLLTAGQTSVKSPQRLSRIVAGLRRFDVCRSKSRASESAIEEIMPNVETRLRQELHNYAVELRQLAYTLPNGAGEHDLLRLSERMHTAVDQVVRKGA